MIRSDGFSRLIAFDVETPNTRNHRMSAIGVTVIEHGAIVDSFGALVDPETEFDAFNVALTGITPEAVEGAPAFPALWERIGPLMLSGVLLAHNAPFDMRVLSRCLMDYEIDVPRFARYACTVHMGRACYPRLPDRKLNTMCRYLGIPLEHHRADSDSMACARLALDYMEQSLDLKRFIRTYDLWEGHTAK